MTVMMFPLAIGDKAFSIICEGLICRFESNALQLGEGGRSKDMVLLETVNISYTYS